MVVLAKVQAGRHNATLTLTKAASTKLCHNFVLLRKGPAGTLCRFNKFPSFLRGKFSLQFEMLMGAK